MDRSFSISNMEISQLVGLCLDCTARLFLR